MVGRVESPPAGVRGRADEQLVGMAEAVAGVSFLIFEVTSDSSLALAGTGVASELRLARLPDGHRGVRRLGPRPASRAGLDAHVLPGLQELLLDKVSLIAFLLMFGPATRREFWA